MPAIPRDIFARMKSMLRLSSPWLGDPRCPDASRVRAPSQSACVWAVILFFSSGASAADTRPGSNASPVAADPVASGAPNAANAAKLTGDIRATYDVMESNLEAQYEKLNK